MGDTSIKIDNTTYAEAPPIITPDIAIFWDPASKELLMQIEGGDKEAMTLSRKARTFLKCKCIEKQGDKYICKPIQGYNQTTYTIDLENQQCNCQGFSKSHFCSHILAVNLFTFMEEHNAKNT